MTKAGTAGFAPARTGGGNPAALARRQFVLEQLNRPRTQAELRDRLGMSRSGTLHLLRRMARDGLIRPAEKAGVTQIWERQGPMG